MTTYSFTAGSTQAFNPSSDVLSFGQGISASDVAISSLSTSTIFTTNSGSMVLTGLTLGNITTTNVVFANGSELLVGDNTTGTSGDSSANTVEGSSGNDQLFGMGGSDILGGGAGNDIIFGGANSADSTDAADIIDGGAGSDVIYANGGNDSVTGSSNASQDSIYGGAGNDTVNYSASSDSIIVYGNAGNDTLTGSGGADIIYGGSSASDSSDAADSINGGAGADVIYANGGADSVSGTAGTDAVYAGGGNDVISYSGSADAVLIYGNGDSDNLTGSSGNDTIYGGNSSSDTTDAADTVNGGSGNDVIYGNSGADSITGTAGADTVYGGGDGDRINYSSNNSATLVYGNGGADTLTGGTGNDTIYGGSSSSDTSDSSDSITAGAGADIVYANSGDDTITGTGDGTAASTIYGGEGADSINWSAVTGGHGATLSGNGGNDSITGSTGAADSITGGSGNDTLTFAANGDLTTADTIYGGDSAADSNGDSDTLTFSVNDITLTSGDLTNARGFEKVTFVSDATNTINSITLNDNFANSTASGVLAISLATQAAGTGTLTVNAAALTSTSTTISVIGGSGEDTFTGGNTKDVFTGGIEDDTMTFAVSAFGSNDTLYGGTSSTDSNAETDTLTFSDAGTVASGALSNKSGFEAITLANGTNSLSLTDAFVSSSAKVGADAKLTITGGTGADTIDASLVTTSTNILSISAGNGNNSITGGAGADTIIGGTDADTMLGNGGNDTFSLAATSLTGSDVITGGTGTDTLTFSSTGVVTAAEFANVSAIETITLNAGGNDVAITDAMSTSATGGLSITGGAGNDTVDGALATTGLTITGASGDDSLTGGSEGDVFATTVANLTANDTLAGGTGTDTLKFTDDGAISAGSFDGKTGIDAISLLASGAVTLNLSDAFVDESDSNRLTVTLQGTNAVTVNASALTSGRTVNITGSDGNDTLTGGAGEDTIFGGNGTNSITGGAGSDSLVGGSGVDTFATTVADLTSSETISGGASNDILKFTDDGTIALSADSRKSGIDTISLLASSTGTILILTDQFVNASDSGTVAVTLQGDSAVTVNASALASGRIVNITGRDGDDTLIGGAGNDTISSGNGTNSITGGAGADSLTGGTGVDTFAYVAADWTSANDATVVGATGSDIIKFTDTDTTITDAQFANIATIEALQFKGTSSTHSITLGTNVNTLIAGNTGTSLTMTYQTAQSGNVTLAASALTGNISFTSGSGDDTLTGGSGADTISSGNGTNSITGGAGADSLTGGIGADIFAYTAADWSSANDATVIGAAGSDIIRFTDPDGTISDAQFARIATIEAIQFYGTSSTHIITLGANASTLIAGNTGASLTMTYQNAQSGNVVLNGSALTQKIDFTSGSGDDTLTGGSGNDSITGGDGGDSITGGGGTADSLAGGEGNDIFSITSAEFTNLETIEGGNGIDTILFTDAATVEDAGFECVRGIEVLSFSANVTSIVLAEHAAANIASSTDNTLELANGIYTIDSLNTSALDSEAGGATVGGTGLVTLSNAGNRVFSKDDSNTSITGGTNADTIVGGTGNDTFSGGGGLDSISGGAGQDTITGNADADIITLGSGDAVTDTVSWTATTDGATAGSASTGYDAITDFVAGTDKIAFGGALFTALDDDSGSSLTVAADAVATNAFDDSTMEVAVFATAVTNAQLVTDALTEVIAAIGTLTNVITGDDAIFVVKGGSQSGVYYFLENGTSVTTVVASELTLLGVVDAVLTSADVFVTTV